MKNAILRDDVLNGLKLLGVHSKMALEVHCSLSRFGYVEGGSAALIDALIEAVGIEGAIVMPSFRFSRQQPLTEEDKRLGLTLKIQIISEDEESSGMGIVSDTFRKRPDVKTGEGIFRVSAWGQDADKHSAGFQHLIDSDGFALMLGVDIYSLSSMHYVEDVLPKEIRSRFEPSAQARKVYPEDEWIIECWKPDVQPWYKIQNEAYLKGLIKDSYIGNAKCMLFKVKPVIDLYRQALLNNPFELYGLA